MKIFIKHANTEYNLLNWLILSPLVVSLGVFVLFAFAKTAIISLQHYDFFSAATWAGLSNFSLIFNDASFIKASINTILFTVIGTVIQVSLALVISLSLHRGIKSSFILKDLLYLPALFSSASMAIICLFLVQSSEFWRLIQAPAMLLLWFVTFAALIFIVVTIKTIKYKKCAFLTVGVFMWLAYTWIMPPASTEFSINPMLSSYDSWLGLTPPLWLLLIQNCIINVPVYCLLLMSALNGISDNLYRAARCDGASAKQVYQHITLPLIEPVIMIMLILSTISGMQIFEQVFFLGNSVPAESKLTLAQFIYQHVFPTNGNPSVGVASAAAVIMSLLLLILTLFPATRLLKNKKGF